MGTWISPTYDLTSALRKSASGCLTDRNTVHGRSSPSLRDFVRGYGIARGVCSCWQRRLGRLECLAGPRECFCSFFFETRAWDPRRSGAYGVRESSGDPTGSGVELFFHILAENVTDQDFPNTPRQRAPAVSGANPLTCSGVANRGSLSCLSSIYAFFLLKNGTMTTPYLALCCRRGPALLCVAFDPFLLGTLHGRIGIWLRGGICKPATGPLIVYVGMAQ